ATIKAKPELFLSAQDAKLVKTGTFDNMELLKDCDMIVEVVIEDLKIKKSILEKVAAVRKPGSIICTNTSGISLKAMSQDMPEEMQQHFIGTHFFNPVRYMELLEIIPGPKTLPELVRFIADFEKERLGKGIVIAKDVPGFAGNRVGVCGLTIAMQKMIEHDLTIPEVDALMGKAIGRPKTGIFKTSDLVGLDTAGKVAQYLYAMCKDDKRRNMLKIPDFTAKMVEKGHLGKKTPKKGGFYKTEKIGKGIVRSVIDYKTLTYGPLEKPQFACLAAAKKARSAEDSIKAIVYGDDKGALYAKDVIFSQLAYAASMVGIVAENIVDIDNAMKWGYNFELGHFELWDAIGVEKSVSEMEKSGIKVPESIKKMLSKKAISFYKTEKGKKFFFDFKSQKYMEMKVDEKAVCLFNLKQNKKSVLSNKGATLHDAGDGVFIFEIHTNPVNALDESALKLLDKAFDYVNDNGAGLIIGNNHDFFSAGANLGLVMGLIGQKNFKGISEMAGALQHLVYKAKYANYPVAAAVYGRALGGGCELIMGCDRVLAHPNTFMGLVEMGVGLIPAGSGSTSLYSRVINSVPPCVAGNDLGKFVEAVFSTIAMAKVSMSAKQAFELGFLKPTDKIVPARSNLFKAAKEEILHMVKSGYSPEAPKPIKVMGQDGFGMLNAGILSFEEGGFIAPHSAKVARGVARIITGGDTAPGVISEQTMLALEREVFTELCKDQITVEKIIHILTTGKPLLK
ncbi:MAG: 3-hydroxyacyl-CoA dehydrogenase/enoyl-CoA hydratase family protein, partial [Deltaproteobacteria bacterium]|nr:3-hydroxyacyl-CoA dehydrogenase/enoyl-CoA hydratase family protein [Deltaproteobacteria bacterium]